MRPTPEARGPRSLAPREHGAYGQLFVPLVTAFAMGHFKVGVLAIAVAVVAVFFAHEPLLILFGRRGEKARREDGARARSRAIGLGAIAIAAGAVAAAMAPWSAVLAGGPVLLAASVVAWLAARGEEKTAAGEVFAAGSLSGASIPVGLAAGVPLGAAAGAWCAFTLAFAASTLAVRSVISHAKAPVAAPRRVLPVLAIAIAAPLAAAVVPAWCAVAAAPMIATALWIAAFPPSPRSLRKVGWTLVGSSLAASATLIAGAHL